MSNIDRIVRRAAGTVPAGYTNKVDAVVAALEEASYGVADNLVRQARALGATEAQAKRAVEAAGLSFRPAPVATARATAEPTAKDTKTLLAEISVTLQKIADKVTRF